MYIQSWSIYIFDLEEGKYFMAEECFLWITACLKCSDSTHSSAVISSDVPVSSQQVFFLTNGIMSHQDHNVLNIIEIN